MKKKQNTTCSNAIVRRDRVLCCYDGNNTGESSHNSGHHVGHWPTFLVLCDLMVVLMLLCRVLTGLLGRQDRKATWVSVERDPRANLAFQGRLEGPVHRVLTHTMDETSPRSAHLVIVATREKRSVGYTAKVAHHCMSD